MAHIHFIGGEKGGVGKSLVARLLAQHWIDHGQTFTGFDTDRSHGALMRFYAGYATPIVLDRPDALDAVMEAAAASPDARVLVDLAAQTADPLVRWMDETGAVELAAESGIGITHWHVMDAGRDSVDLLQRVLDRFGNGIGHVLVRNELRGDDFRLLDQSGLQTRAVDLGARTMRIRRLADNIAQRIDGTSSSFWAAQQSGTSGEAALGLMDRQRLKVWLRDVTQQLEGLAV